MRFQKKILSNVGKYMLAFSAVGTTSINSFANTDSLQNSNATQSRNTPSLRNATKNVGHVAGELLIKYKANVNHTIKTTVAQNYRLNIIKNYADNRRLLNSASGMARWQHVNVVGVTNDAELRKAMDELRNNPAIEKVEYNFRYTLDNTPNDPFFDQTWGMNNTGQSGGTNNADIDAPEAWDIQTGSEDVVIGIIDTGIKYDHPDLKNNMWINPGEIADNGIDDDGNGYIDDVYGWDFIDGDNDPMDEYGHGTHCAGTIAAEGNNGIGVAGVSWKAKLMALRIFDANGDTDSASAVDAVLYANAMGVKITSNSWGGGPYSQALYDAISEANDEGNLFIAAAGNSTSNNDEDPHYPSNFDLPNIIAVAAVNHNDVLADFSSYGAESVDIAAPGEDIYSTSLSNGETMSNSSGYMFASGTSMATPHVAGAAALLLAETPSITGEEIKQKILSSSRYSDTVEGSVSSNGILNINNMLENDSEAPAALDSVAIKNKKTRSIALKWDITGDDGTEGEASFYEVRYSTSNITESNYEQATIASFARPSDDTTQTYTVAGLEPETTYYFAIKAFDNVGNASDISNVIHGTTKEEYVLFNDPMDTLANWKISGTEYEGEYLWHISDHRFASPSNALYYGIASTYNYITGDANQGSATLEDINLGALKSAVLSFSYFLETEDYSGYDIASIEVKEGNNDWEEIFSTSSSTGDMKTEYLPLDDYAGKIISLRFSFDTVDGSANGYEGWVVDDVIIAGELGDNGMPPEAVISGDDTITVYAGQSVSFDGSNSSDPEGEALTYAWDFGDNSTATGVSTSHTFTSQGSYTVSLTVDDGTLTDKDNVIVNVLEVPADAGGPYKGYVNKAITLNAVPFEPATSYKWTFGDGTSKTTTTPSVSHVYTVPGNFSASVRVITPDAFSKPASALVRVKPVYFGNFANYDPMQNPVDWTDSGAHNNTAQAEYFHTVDVDGQTVFGTQSEATNIHSHYTGTMPFDIAKGYQYTGKMRYTDDNSKIGVTFFSQYPKEMGYYRLDNQYGDFRLSAKASVIKGDKRSYLTPKKNTWYKFRIRVNNNSQETNIVARVWEEGKAEPTQWHMEVTDTTAGRFKDGTFGTWASSKGEKYWDKLNVISLGTLPDVIYAPNALGLREKEALPLFTSAGFKVKTTYVFDNELPEDEVISQSINAGESAYKGDIITIVISMGEQVWLEVPDLVDLMLEDAEAEIFASGFMLGEVTEEYDELLPEGMVISQSTPAGDYLIKGDSIDLVVSKGAETP